MRNFILAVTLIVSVGMTAFVVFVLVDEIRMNISFGEYSRRSYIIWPLILLVSIAGIVVSWVSLPGGKWFIFVLYIPLTVLLALAIRYGERRYIGSLVLSLLLFWTLAGPFVTFQVDSIERGQKGLFQGSSEKGCTYDRVPGTLSYEWTCPGDS